MYGPLLRPRFDRRIAGVCAAFARSYGWDLTLVRLVVVLLVLFGGGGVLAYLICWIVIPEEPYGTVPPQAYPGQYPPPAPQNYPPQYDQTYPPNTPPTEPPAAS